MADYKSMYYHLAGRVAGAVDSLEASTVALQASTAALQATNSALVGLMESLKKAQQTTEEMFISCEDDDGENDV